MREHSLVTLAPWCIALEVGPPVHPPHGEQAAQHNANSIKPISHSKQRVAQTWGGCQHLPPSRPSNRCRLSVWASKLHGALTPSKCSFTLCVPLLLQPRQLESYFVRKVAAQALLVFVYDFSSPSHFAQHLGSSGAGGQLVEHRRWPRGCLDGWEKKTLLSGLPRTSQFGGDEI